LAPSWRVRTPCYRIIVSGGLGEAGREAFRDFHIETHGGDSVLWVVMPAHSAVFRAFISLELDPLIPRFTSLDQALSAGPAPVVRPAA